MGWVGTAGTWPLGDRLNTILNGLMPSYWQCGLGSCSIPCFPASVAVKPHWGALLPPSLMRSLDTCRTYTTHPCPRRCLPFMGTLRLVQISRIFLVKLWAV